MDFAQGDVECAPYVVMMMTMMTPGSRSLRVIVTGASSGIGEQMAYIYASRGCRVALFARRRSQLETVAAKCQSLGADDVSIVAGDQSIQRDCNNLIDFVVEKWKGIDVLVLNAGTYIHTLIHCQVSRYMAKLEIIQNIYRMLRM